MTPSENIPLEGYFGRMVRLEASDLFLRAGSAPAYRVDGQIVRSDLPPPSDDDMRQFLGRILTPIARRRFEQSPDVDVAFALPELGRFRISVFSQQGKPAFAARLIPPGHIDFETLNLPGGILKMADAPEGLVLVVGPTGCGKSTTLAALLHHINATRPAHIVTIEDPIEFVHDEQMALIHQRQVGYDTADFSTALRHVVRQSPDVILIGEIRDAETVQTALAAAMTGHLVFSTLHTLSAVQSVERMLQFFPGEARQQIQADLAATLVGIVSMRLLPRIEGRGRIPATEILQGTPTARRIIGEGKLDELPELMKGGRDAGMMTLNQSLVRLCRQAHVEWDTALRVAPNREQFRLNMQGMTTGTDPFGLRTGMAEDAELE